MHCHITFVYDYGKFGWQQKSVGKELIELPKNKKKHLMYHKTCEFQVSIIHTYFFNNYWNISNFHRHRAFVARNQNRMFLNNFVYNIKFKLYINHLKNKFRSKKITIIINISMKLDISKKTWNVWYVKWKEKWKSSLI